MATPTSAALTYNPASQEYSEISTSRIIVRVEPADGSTGDKSGVGAHVSYWDSVSGGAMSRNIAQRKEPGKTIIKKVPGLHLMVAALTLTRAWNAKVQHQEPLRTFLKAWFGGTGGVIGLRLKVTQMIQNDDGTYTDIDTYIGPISSYEGPKGNVEGDDFAKETLTVDPETYELLQN
jgi:hypothetical protein